MRTVLHSCLIVVGIAAPQKQGTPAPVECTGYFKAHGVLQDPGRLAAAASRTDARLRELCDDENVDTLKFVKEEFAAFERRLNLRAQECRRAEVCQVGTGIMRTFVEEKTARWKDMEEKMEALLTPADGEVCSAIPAPGHGTPVTVPVSPTTAEPVGSSGSAGGSAAVRLHVIAA
jgi:hypothetical protein